MFTGLYSWILSLTNHFWPFEVEVHFDHVSYKETKSLWDFVKARLQSFILGTRETNGRKIHSMGNFWPLSNLNLSNMWSKGLFPGWIKGHLKHECSESERRWPGFSWAWSYSPPGETWWLEGGTLGFCHTYSLHGVQGNHCVDLILTYRRSGFLPSYPGCWLALWPVNRDSQDSSCSGVAASRLLIKPSPVIPISKSQTLERENCRYRSDPVPKLKL